MVWSPFSYISTFCDFGLLSRGHSETRGTISDDKIFKIGKLVANFDLLECSSLRKVVVNFNLQVWTIRPFPGRENVSGKLRQKW